MEDVQILAGHLGIEEPAFHGKAEDYRLETWIGDEIALIRKVTEPVLGEFRV